MTALKEPKKKKSLSQNPKLNKALDQSIEEMSSATKKSSRMIFDALIEEGVKTISDLFDKYKIIVKQKVIKDEPNNEERKSE